MRRDRAQPRARRGCGAVLSAKLLSGDVPDRVLDEFVQVLLEALGLASCQVSVTLDGQDIEAQGGPSGRSSRRGRPRVIPVVVANIPLGTLIAERPEEPTPVHRRTSDCSWRQRPGRRPVALDRARLDARARLAQLDAETNQLRAAMFSSVTHDLRTPLRVDQGRGDEPARREARSTTRRQQRELLTTILEETDRLNRLVRNILDLAKIRAGALIPKPSADCRRRGRGSGRGPDAPPARRLRGRANSPPDLPEVAADPVQLDQVLTNLLEDAARHSPSGGTTSDPRRRNARRVHACASPTRGSGIKPRSVRRCSKRFYRGRESPESSGSGLGLAIAQCHRQRPTAGRIRIEETPGGGSRGSRVERPARGDGAVKVLVVDDEPQIRRALRTSLEAHGYEVAAVGHGRRGWSRSADQPPDLVLLDLGACPTWTAPR